MDRLLTIERQLIDALAREARAAEATILATAGYHRHDRGGWRLRRDRKAPMSDAPVPAALPPAGPIENLLAELRRRAEETQRRLSTTRAQAVALLDDAAGESPGRVAALIEEHGGDPARLVEEVAIAKVAGKDQIRREAIRRHLAWLRSELAGAGPIPAAERLIVDRTTTCWLVVHAYEHELARRLLEGKYSSMYDQRRLDHAQKRFLECVRALDQVRRKTPAAHRLNVAVLLAGPPQSPAPPAAIDVTPPAPAIDGP